MNQPAPKGHNNPPSQAEIIQAQLDLVTEADRAKIDELVKTEVPDVIEDEVTAARFTDLTKEIQTVYSRFEKTREIEKAPHLAATRQVDDYFKPGKQMLEVLKAKINRPLTAYAKKKADEERERQAAEAKRLREQAEEEARKARELERVGLSEHADVQLHQATKTEAKAIKIERQTTAELSTVRGVSAMSGLRTKRTLKLVDKEALDLNKLRPYLKPADLQTALNAYFAANGTAIAGAEITEESSINVR